MIVVDAYRQPYIPFYLATREFFELVRDRLEPGRRRCSSTSATRRERTQLEKVLGATMSAVFPTVLRDPSEDTNTQLLGSAAPGVRRAACGSGARSLPPDLRPLARATADRLAPALAGGDVYTDDRAPGGVADRPLDRRLRGRRLKSPQCPAS